MSSLVSATPLVSRVDIGVALTHQKHNKVVSYLFICCSFYLLRIDAFLLNSVRF
jgi:hypothetical protein